MASSNFTPIYTRLTDVTWDVAHAHPPCASMIERRIDSPILIPFGLAGTAKGPKGGYHA